MNEALTVRVSNPHDLREALLIALEATWPDLSVEQVSALKDFTLGISSQTKPANIHLLRTEQVALLGLAGYFRTTRTCRWMPSKLQVPLSDLMIPLQKGAKS